MFKKLKKIKIDFNIGFSTFLVLIFMIVFTLILSNQRDILVFTKELRNGNYAGVGTEIPKSLKISNWRNYYGGSMGIDDSIRFEGSSIRISTGLSGGWYGARADIKAIDMTEKSIRFAVRFDDFNAVKTFLIILGSDSGKLDNYFSFNVKNFFADPINNTWHEIIVDKSDFVVAQGKPDWSNITDISLRVSAESGVYTRVWFGGFSYIENKKDPIITLTFDDGFKTNILASEIMERYGFKGTAYIIPSYLNQFNFLSQSDVDFLHGIGWDISGHGHTNLRLYSLVDVDTQLSTMRSYLDSHNYKGKQHFSYPNGGYTDSVRSLVSEYFETARTIDGLSQPQGYIIPTKVNAKTVSIIHSVDEVKSWIDDAIRDKSWLIITWHDLVQVPTRDIEYKISDFEEIVDYISKKNVKVLPFSDAYKTIIEK